MLNDNNYGKSGSPIDIMEKTKFELPLTKHEISTTNSHLTCTSQFQLKIEKFPYLLVAIN